MKRLWVERVSLSSFRNYASASLEVGPEPVVLVGPNGAGKTNFLEAISLLAPGQGLRRAAFADIARVARGDRAAAGGGQGHAAGGGQGHAAGGGQSHAAGGNPTRAGGDGSWAVAARLHARDGAHDVGTGLNPGGAGERAGRIVRIDGTTQSSGALADLVEMVWLTPAMDGLFTGPASDRRRFLDRLILCFDSAHGTRANRFERAMQSRNRLLADGVRQNAELAGFELQMAETGVALAAARVEALAALAGVIAERRARHASSPSPLPFPWAGLAIDGSLEAALVGHAAIEVEERYARELAETRERDRGAGRTLSGPHRSDLVVEHGPKAMPARLSSTGEQKALLLGLVLAHAELIAARRDGYAPLLLLDEVTAHLDESRRAALFAEIGRLGVQAWMTGTDLSAFAALGPGAQRLSVCDGQVQQE